MKARARLSLSRLRADMRGASVTEFGIILIPLTVLLTGSIDVGYQVYARAVVTGAVEQATRAVTIEGASSGTVDTTLTNAVKSVMPSATVAVTSGTFQKYSQMDAMERLTSDANGNNVLDSGDCWEDVDDSGNRNIPTVGKSGIGGADDIVRYTVAATYNRLTPIYRFTGGSSTATITVTNLVKRQPFAGQATPAIRCKP